MMIVDINKKYRIGYGDEVVYLTDTKHPTYPIVGYLKDSDNPVAWTREGLHWTENHYMTLQEVVPVDNKIDVLV